MVRNFTLNISYMSNSLLLNLGSISSTFYEQLLRSQIPKAPKSCLTWLSFLRFWDLRVQKLPVERWWNWPLLTHYLLDILGHLNLESLYLDFGDVLQWRYFNIPLWQIYLITNAPFWLSPSDRNKRFWDEKMNQNLSLSWSRVKNAVRQK